MFRFYLGAYVKVVAYLTSRCSYMAHFIYTDSYNLYNYTF